MRKDMTDTQRMSLKGKKQAINRKQRMGPFVCTRNKHTNHDMQQLMGYFLMGEFFTFIPPLMLPSIV